MQRIISATISLVVIIWATGMAQAADPAAGQAKADVLCAGCHGAQGEGKGDNHSLKGQSSADLVKAMQAYKSGARQSPPMNAIFKGVSDEDIQDLGAYYSTVKIGEPGIADVILQMQGSVSFFSLGSLCVFHAPRDAHATKTG